MILDGINKKIMGFKNRRWSGDSNGKSGLFPNNYVELVLLFSQNEDSNDEEDSFFDTPQTPEIEPKIG
jgi:hypothetical protein